MAKLEEKSEDKLQAAGAADPSQATATGWVHDKVLQTTDLGDVKLETPDSIYHETAKFYDDNPAPRIFMYSDAIWKRSQEGELEGRGITKYLIWNSGTSNKGTLNGCVRPRFKPVWLLVIFLLATHSAVES